MRIMIITDAQSQHNRHHEMPKRSRKGASDEPPSPHDDDATPIDGVPPPEPPAGADASDASRISRRRDTFSRIARERASFFALGGGVGRGQVAEAGAQSSAVAAPDAAGAASWPGPFSTAMQLIAGRDDARRAREASAAATSGEGEVDNADEEEPEASCNPHVVAALERVGVRLRDFRPTWQPKLRFSAEIGADEMSALSADPASSPSSTSNAVPRRRAAVAVAGPSGVRLQVPALTALCMEVRGGQPGGPYCGVHATVHPTGPPRRLQTLAPLLSHIESLDALSSDLRRRFAAVACR